MFFSLQWHILTTQYSRLQYDKDVGNVAMLQIRNPSWRNPEPTFQSVRILIRF